MCKHCKKDMKFNPEWDSLLDDSEKEWLKDALYSLKGKLYHMSAKDVKVVVTTVMQIYLETFQEDKEEEE